MTNWVSEKNKTVSKLPSKTAMGRDNIVRQKEDWNKSKNLGGEKKKKN